MDTVRESALKIHSGRKIPCRTGDSNPRLAFQSDALTAELSTPPSVLLGSLKTERKINNSFLSVCLFFIWGKEKPQALQKLAVLYRRFLCSTVKYSCAIRYTGSTANRGSLQLWCDSHFAKRLHNLVQCFQTCFVDHIHNHVYCLPALTDQCIAGSGMKMTP